MPEPLPCHRLDVASVTRALAAAANHPEHCLLIAPGTTVRYGEAVARRVAAARVFVYADLQVMAGAAAARKALTNGGLLADQHRAIGTHPDPVASYLATVRSLRVLVVPIVARSESGW